MDITNLKGLHLSYRTPLTLRNGKQASFWFLEKWQHALLYLDDVVMFSQTTAEPIDHDRIVLNFLRHAIVILKLKSMSFLEVLLIIWDSVLGQDAWK